MSQLVSTIDAALKRLADKHWAQVKARMIEQGFAPEAGGILVLPQAEEATAPGHRPDWVHFSANVASASLVNPRSVGLT